MKDARKIKNAIASFTNLINWNWMWSITEAGGYLMLSKINRSNPNRDNLFTHFALVCELHVNINTQNKEHLRPDEKHLPRPLRAGWEGSQQPYLIQSSQGGSTIGSGPREQTPSSRWTDMLKKYKLVSNFLVFDDRAFV